MTSFGRPHRHLRLTDSTNERGRELIELGAPSGTIVTADAQTAGRGRHGRAWSAPAGKALLLSAVLRDLGERHALLPLVVPLAVCDAIEKLAPVSCGVKWPNDVWIDASKVAGMLIEARPPEWAVIGIGVNVAIEAREFPADLRWPATSIGHGAGVEAAVAAVCDALSARVGEPVRETLADFHARDALLDREVSWQGAGEGSGLARGVDERGNLVVETEAGTRLALGSGEIQLRVGG